MGSSFYAHGLSPRLLGGQISSRHLVRLPTNSRRQLCSSDTDATWFFFAIEYHFVWVTKYRYKVLAGEVAERVRDLVRQTCEAFEMRIAKGVVSKAHVHILVSVPPRTVTI